MKTPSGLPAFLTSCMFAISPAITFGQPGGGGHAGSGHAGSIGTHSSTSSRGESVTSASRGSTEAAKGPSVVVVSGRPDSEGGGDADRRLSEEGNSSATAPNDRWLNSETKEAASSTAVTIGFPGSPTPTFSTSALTVMGERNTVAEGQVQRGARPAVPVTRPAPTAPVMTPPPVPMTRPLARSVPLPPIRSMQIQPRHALWFLASPSPSHIFRRRFFGGFGFFGFGLPFSFGFGPDCNPFWAEPFAFGCNTFGYFGGYGGYALAPPEQENQVEPSQEQESESNVFIPPEDRSSPEEIEAEKVLFVLYMKNGALYAVTNYWIEDGKLHYLTSYGGENTIDMSDLDLQKTVDVNAKRGVNFTLKPRSDQDQTKEPQQ